MQTLSLFLILLVFFGSCSFAADEPGPETLSDRAASIKALERLEKGGAPGKVYSVFNNFADLNFGAETAPQMHEKFGDELTVEQGAEWHHISERSAALAWSTNLPAISYVEYGEDERFDLKSETSERPFHNHLHYLEDLKRNSRYFYRTVSIDERGNRLLSPAASFTTADIAAVIRIPGDMPGGPPYKLDKPDAAYLLTQDISAEHTIIEILGAGIRLDLGGHTLTYSNSAAIRAHDGSRQRGPIKIVNGKIRQSDTAWMTDTADVLHPMEISAGRGGEIAGVTVEYHTPQTFGMVLSEARGRWRIHHNVYVDRGVHIFNRHGTGGARSLLFRNPSVGANDFHLSHNRVSRTRQNGFHIAQHQYNNEIYVDSWTTNSFALQPNAAEGSDSGKIHNNKIYLTGYNAVGIGWGRRNLIVSDNFIQMAGINSGDRRWYEAFGDRDSLNGLRMTNYGSGGQVRSNIHYRDNLIVGYARAGGEMRGTELWTDYSISAAQVTNTQITVEADEQSTQACAVVAHGNRNPGAVPLKYKNMRLMSNVCHIRFGDYYGVGYSHRFYDVEFIKTGDDHPAYHTIIFDGGGSRDGHIIRDALFGPGTAYDDVYWKWTGSGSSYDIEWSAALRVNKNASVIIYDVNGDEIYNGRVTDGRLRIPLKEVTIRPREWRPGAAEVAVKERHAHQKIFHTPHLIVVDGVEHRVNMRRSQTLDFTSR